MVISLSDTVFTSKTLLVQSSFSIQLYPLATGNRVVNPAKTEMTAFEDHIASTFRITMHSTVTLYLGVRRGARWPSGLSVGLYMRPDCPGRVRIPLRKTSLRNFGNSVHPALPVSFGGDTKSCRSLLSGVYAMGSKISHQSALECVTVVDSTTLREGQL